MQAESLGSCLCGAVRFKIEGTFERFYLEGVLNFVC